MAAIEGASFRDPSGFIFQKGGIIYRQVNSDGREDYDLLMSSGLYPELSGSGMLVSHEECGNNLSPESDAAYKVIKPQKIPFISYPYEWSFTQLKDAALLTLNAHKRALEKGMALKDASAYNVQFKGCAPIMIDTLSFEKYREGEPWAAYGQFCRHFLAPLALMSMTDIRLSSLMKIYMDGLPLDLASKLLPFWSYFDPSLLTNIHLHARSQKHYEGRGIKTAEIKGRINKFGMLAIIDGLETAVRGLKWRPGGTEWADYYEATNYSGEAFSDKKRITASFIEKTGLRSGVAWDLGANDGTFSALAAKAGLYTAAFDIDPAAVEKNFIRTRKNRDESQLPLLCDLINPSPSIGWMNEERKSLINRGPADLVIALALVHHLAISNNTPLSRIAEFFRACGKFLIVEFVPKEDTQAQRLLASRRNIFGSYDEENFKKELSGYFEIIGSEKVKGTARAIYLMKGK
jgi:ribosomal protein L11 methylase PrmA